MTAMHIVSLVLVGVCLVACEPAEEPAAPARDVIIDADMDFDDTVALAYLCREHEAGRIRIRAFVAENSGAGYPGKAIRHLRCLREQCGLLDVPIADGSAEAPHAFPPEIRDYADGILTEVFAGCDQTEQHSEIGAPELIEHILSDAETRSIDILTFGPLTNVAQALDLSALRGSKAAAGIGRVHTMGGAVQVPGNLCCGLTDTFDDTQEFNIFVDPSAAARVLYALPPGGMTFVPLDATRFVPIERDFIDRLVDSARTPEAMIVAAIARRLTPDGTLYWWDPLSAIAAVHPDVVTGETLGITVIEEGPSAGRTVLDATGQPSRVATHASRDLFERYLLDTLNDSTR